MNRLLIFSWLILCATLSAQSPPVLAKIGTIELSAQEVREIMVGLNPEQQAAIAKDPSILSQYVRALLIQRLVLKQATEQKWDQEPAVIAKLVRARETALSESFLEKASDPGSEYPNEAELSDAYEMAKPKLLVPKSYHLAQIYIASDRGKLDSTVKQLKSKNADFAAIARAASEESVSAAKGGEIGWLTEDQIQPEIREKLPKLNLGALSDPIAMKDGWHVIKVLDVREPYTPTLDQIRPQLLVRLRTERIQQKRQEYLAQLLKEHPIAINEIELTHLTPKP
jgi:parvulin-like peptidyl-prolyl isomerase